MAAKVPPVPAEQVSPKGPGGGRPAPADTTAHGKAAQVPKNLAEQGRQGNIRQNTVHKGYQQDR